MTGVDLDSQVSIPSSARWSFAEHEADKLTSSFSAPPIPVLEIAERNGVDVVFQNFGSYSSSVAGFCDFKQQRLYVNSDDPPARQAFTMAHELGHWLLHRNIFISRPDLYPVLPRFQSTDRRDVLEQEANRFAACLLVPARLLKPVISFPIIKLAEIFGVSQVMMDFRVQNVQR